MGTHANPLDDPADAAALAGYAAVLVDAIEQELPGWIERAVVGRWRQWSDAPPGEDLRSAAHRAGDDALAEALPALRTLLESDVDEQRTNPLSILRRSARHATDALATAGVPPIVRDEQAERLLPEDRYDLGPAAFADLGPSVHEAGLVWGAAKAHIVLARRRTPRT